MNHDAIRELLALRLYGEASPEEDQRATDHLQGCAACRAFALALDAGLGGLPRHPWSRATAPARRHPVRLAVAAALLGYLAGGLFGPSFSATSLSTPKGAWGRAAVPTRASAELPSGQAPPAVTSGGRLSRLGSYLRR